MTSTARPDKAETRARIKTMHGEGKARNVIARELGLAPSTVGAHAKVMGLKWDRTASAAATAAKLTDLGARRANLVGEMMDLAEDTMKEIRAGKLEVVVVTQAGKIVRTERAADMADRRSAMVIGGIAIDKATKLLDRDAGQDAAESTLDMLERAVTAQALAMIDGDQTTD